MKLIKLIFLVIIFGIFLDNCNGKLKDENPLVKKIFFLNL